MSAGAEYLKLLDAEIELWAPSPRGAAGGVAGAPGRRHTHLPVGRGAELADGPFAPILRWLPGPRSRSRSTRAPRPARGWRIWQQLGFNRISYGVQDFDPRVQQAVHRVQSFEQCHELMAEGCPRTGLRLHQLDLIYGLPLQTKTGASIATLQQVLQLRPDRIALYAYAHLPHRFKPQRRIHSADCPTADVRPHARRCHCHLHRGRLRTTSAWTTSRCPATRWPQAKRQGRCTATSRATPRSPIAT
jgi:hypothetical protein